MYCVGKCKHGTTVAADRFPRAADDPIKATAELAEFGRFLAQKMQDGLTFSAAEDDPVVLRACKQCSEERARQQVLLLEPLDASLRSRTGGQVPAVWRLGRGAPRHNDNCRWRRDGGRAILLVLQVRCCLRTGLGSQVRAERGAW